MKRARKWQATEPNQIHLLDCFCKIVNHQEVFQAVLLDDYSRKALSQFFKSKTEMTQNIVRFTVLGFTKLGIPEELYVENDLTYQALQPLAKVLAKGGSFKLKQLMPGNPRITGKLELYRTANPGSEKQ